VGRRHQGEAAGPAAVLVQADRLVIGDDDVGIVAVAFQRQLGARRHAGHIGLDLGAGQRRLVGLKLVVAHKEVVGLGFVVMLLVHVQPF
jgi:hypothetical protein